MSSETTERTIEETKSGVSVTVKSKRGDGTRDQDTVTVKAHYEDLREAGKSVERLNTMLNYQLSEARRNDPANDREEDQ
jgi:hypothetical protein